MTDKTDFYQLKNGLTILGERIEGIRSVSFNILTLGGAAYEPQGCCGAAAVLCDWVYRGAGSRNSQQLMEALDGLGVHHHASVSTYHFILSGAMESAALSVALPIYADMLRQPHLAEDSFELARQLALQELASLDDDPRSKVMTILYEQFYPAPLGRSTLGKKDDLETMTAGQCRPFAAAMLNPAQMIISVAGCYDFDAICRQIERLFADLPAKKTLELTLTPPGERYLHIDHPGAQVHIGLMTKMPPITAGGYYETMAAVNILSGSMSSRLFTEVREKRGLCYAVGAKYHTLKTVAGVSCYAGTTPEKAQQTLEVVWQQFQSLKDGISEDELYRAKVGLKSSLIMQSESSGARAAGIAGDYFLLGRVRSLEEIRAGIENLTTQRILDYLRKNPFETFTAVTIGPKSVQV